MAIYLDNAATSFPKPAVVFRAMERFVKEIGTSSGRGAYRKALEADRLVYEARRALSRLFNTGDATRFVFTSNVTESLNLAIKGILRPGDHVVTTSMEHNAVWRCLRVMEEEGTISISACPCGKDGTLDPADLVPLIKSNTRLIIMLHASNVTGTLMPVKEVGAIARERNTPLLVDAAQTAGVYPIDLKELNIDLLAFTGHKGLLGPQGTGGLYVRQGIELKPLIEGGTGSESRLERQPDNLPDRFEAGTLNIPGIVGLGAAVEYILDQGVENIRDKEKRLLLQTLDGLTDIPRVEIYGPSDPERQVGVISVNLPNVRPEEIAYILDEVHGIMVRAGLHCSPCAHRTIGTLEWGTLRVGLGYLNTPDDINHLLNSLSEIASQS